MRITITLKAHDPPEGELAVQGEAPLPFEGWMGLLSALSERLDRASGLAASDGSDQLQAG